MAIVVPIISSFDNKGITKALADFKKLEGAGQRGAFALLNTNKAVNTAAKNFAKLGAVGIGLAGVIGGSLVKAAYESQRVMKQTDAIIKATGGAAGLTSEQIGKLSTKLSLQTGIDDELIQTSMNLLLTFKQVRNEVGEGNDVFNRAAQAALDLGNVFGSADAAAKMLGKALSDPIKGVSALARAGVNFSQQQKDQIRTLVDSGKTLDAQKLILKEVESQVGGTAAAGATGFDRMKVAIGNVQENLGGLLLPAVERFANSVVDNVLPVLDSFKTIVGEQGIGSGVNFLVGSILNGITKLGMFGKIILGVTAGIVALNVATGIYKTSMIALNIITTLSSGSLSILITRLGQAKIAMLAAGGITALLSLAGILYGTYASQKAKAAQTTIDFTNAILAEGTAQSQAFLELTKNNPQFKIMVASLEEIGITMADVTEYTTKGTGKFKPYVEALAIIESTTGTTINKLDAYAKAIGIAGTATTSAGGSLSFGLSEFAKMAVVARGDATTTASALALLGKIGITAGTNVGTGAKNVETAAEKFKKFSEAAQSAVSQQRSLRDSIKGVTDAQNALTAAIKSVTSAQQNFTNVSKGYGASSKQAAEAQKNLTTAQREATRAGFGLANAQNAVLDAQRKIADLTKAADPRNIQEAQDNLTEAQYRLTDAEEALVEARKSGKQRDIVEAEIAVRDATNGVTDANTALAASQAAADPAALTQAQQDLAAAELDVKDAQDAQKAATDNVTTAQGLLNEAINGAKEGTDAYQEALDKLKDAQKTEEEAIDSLRTAKEREIETTKTLVKANLLLQQSRKKLTSKQIKQANKLITDLNTPVNVPAPTSTTSSSTPSFDFSGIDFSGLDFSGINFGGIATLASGGIAMKPTLALIAEGGEPEAVIPLSKLGGMGGDVYNITINSKIADQTLPDLLVAELRKFNRRSGAIDIQVA